MSLSIGKIGMNYSYPTIQYGLTNNQNSAMISNGNSDLKTGKADIYKDTNEVKEKQTGIDDPIAKASGKEECQTCKNRKYVDGSDEMVSFKSPAKINPEAAMAKVNAHEQEHVSNAYKKAEQNDGKVLQASVTIKTAICPECGKSYIAGGVTHTKIAYPNSKNPYTKNLKSANYNAVAGSNVDLAV